MPMTGYPFHPQPTVVSAGELTTIVFTGAKPCDTEKALGEELRGRADDSGQRRLALDFRNVRSVNSTELGTLIELHKRLGASGRHLILTELTAEVYEVFDVTRLTTFMDIRQEEPTGGLAS